METDSGSGREAQAVASPRRRACVAGVVGLAVIGSALLALPRAFQTVAHDELYWLVAAETSVEDGTPLAFPGYDTPATCSPHLYLGLVVCSLRCFGGASWAARLPGVLLVSVTTLLVYLLGLWASHGSRVPQRGWIAGWTCVAATTALLLQGAAIIDIDNTLLPPLLLALLFAYARLIETSTPRAFFALAAAFALSLWARVTTPSVLAGFLVALAVVRRPGPRALALTLGAFIVGAAGFLATWTAYCGMRGIPAWGPFEYTLSAFRDRQSHSPGTWAKNLAYFLLWLGPVPSIAIGWLAGRRILALWRDRCWLRSDVFLAGGLMVAGGYTIVGGSLFGFPKYQVPAVAMLVAFAASQGSPSTLNGARVVAAMVLASAIAFGLQAGVAGDLLHTIRYDVRMAQVYHPEQVGAIMRAGVSRAALLIAGCAIGIGCLHAWSKAGIASLLLAASLGCNIGTAVHQLTGGYQTGYLYGDQAAGEAARFLEDHVRSGALAVVPPELTHRLGWRQRGYVPNRLWTDLDRLQGLLGSGQASCLVLGVTTQTVEEVRGILHHAGIQSELGAHFEVARFQGYVVWVHK